MRLFSNITWQGNMLLEATGIQKGPLVGRLLDAQLRWQLRNPAGGGGGAGGAGYAEEYQNACAEYLKTFTAAMQNESVGTSAKAKSGR
jgi:hypothetical protein